MKVGHLGLGLGLGLGFVVWREGGAPIACVSEWCVGDVVGHASPVLMNQIIWLDV